MTGLGQRQARAAPGRPELPTWGGGTWGQERGVGSPACALLSMVCRSRDGGIQAKRRFRWKGLVSQGARELWAGQRQLPSAGVIRYY